MKCHHGVNPAMSEAVSVQCSAALGMAACSVLVDLQIKSPLPVTGTCIMREAAPDQSDLCVMGRRRTLPGLSALQAAAQGPADPSAVQTAGQKCSSQAWKSQQEFCYSWLYN